MNTVIKNLSKSEKESFVNEYLKERESLLREFPKLQIGWIDESLNRFPLYSIDKGRIKRNPNKLDRKIFLSLIK